MCLIIENGAFAENLGGEALSRVLGLARGCFLRQAVANVKATGEQTLSAVVRTTWTL